MPSRNHYESPERTYQPAYADSACVSCRRLKRRCTKDLPACSLCSRVGRQCDYPELPTSNTTSRSPRAHTNGSTSVVATTPLHSPSQRFTLQDAIGTAESPRVSSTHYVNRLPKHLLDSVATRGSVVDQSVALQWSSLRTDVQPPSLDEAEDIAQHFFSTIHTWLPIVSKKRLERRLQNEQTIVSADLVCLLYAMRLLNDPAWNGDQTLYLTVKTGLTACESKGELSTACIAARVVVAMFEVGHGLLPAAYLSVAHSSRLFYIMGFHDSRKATQVYGSASTWTENEERRRLWWAVIMLDRFLHVGFRFRPLSIHSIPADEILPADDDAWDLGELTVSPLLVMSVEANTSVSPYARTCQATNLLGKACQHVNEHPNPADVESHFQEAVQIIRAAEALKAMIDHVISRSDIPHRLHLARALCHSALTLLYDVHSCIEGGNLDSAGPNTGLRLSVQQLAIDGFKREAADVLEFSKALNEQIILHGIECSSPLVCNCLYSVAGTYAWLYREAGREEHLDNLNDLRHLLHTLSQRWQIARVYIDLLANTEYNFDGSTYQ